jgi:hypothetical protein
MLDWLLVHMLGCHSTGMPVFASTCNTGWQLMFFQVITCSLHAAAAAVQAIQQEGQPSQTIVNCA